MADKKFEKTTRVYTIPLDRFVLLSPRQMRSKRAVSVIKEFVTKHMKGSGVLISSELNEVIWKKGIRRPPRHITVQLDMDDTGIVTVSTFKEEKKTELEPSVSEVKVITDKPSETTIASENIENTD